MQKKTELAFFLLFGESFLAFLYVGSEGSRMPGQAE
jgi:hypothetical protein